MTLAISRRVSVWSPPLNGRAFRCIGLTTHSCPSDAPSTSKFHNEYKGQSSRVGQDEILAHLRARLSGSQSVSIQRERAVEFLEQE
ncbi:hypothetical protein BDM02DRAFT_3118907 [Thelephora ganbajun]|uniref:Uncharacterized protein n=1 Tax=Thelephora ganbajun TaxID=370292 RepID=A0ACB6ZA61_THEGA|nr:hypothetical protein BDM02DRAFT_3118907 [Thelephora ganbajun]